MDALRKNRRDFLLHIAKDNSVYFSYEFDLSELDSEIDEAKCTLACAEVILKLLSVKKAQKEAAKKKAEEAASAQE